MAQAEYSAGTSALRAASVKVVVVAVGCIDPKFTRC